MKIRTVFLFSIFIFFMQNVSVAQLSVYTKANTYYQNGQYHQAIDLLRDAYSRVTDNDVKSDITFQVAECYRKTNQPRKAEMWYKKAIQKKYNNPLTYLYYADALKMNEKFDDFNISESQVRRVIRDNNITRKRNGSNCISL